jgi:predicted MFS family arabinose efflux permease
MSLYVSGTVSGGFVGRMLAAIVTSHSDWRSAFALLGILNALSAAAIWYLLPYEQHQKRATRGLYRAMVGHLKNPQLLAIYAAGFCVLFSLLGVFTYVNFLLAADPFRMNAKELGRVFTVYLVSAAIMPFVGRIIDRLGQRWAFALAMMVALGGVLLTLIPSVPAILVGLALFCSGIFAGATAVAVGLYVTAYYFGGSFGAAVPGIFWSRFGWPGCVTLIAGTELVTAAIALCFWRNEKTAELSQNPVETTLS